VYPVARAPGCVRLWLCAPARRAQEFKSDLSSSEQLNSRVSSFVEARYRSYNQPQLHGDGAVPPAAVPAATAQRQRDIAQYTQLAGSTLAGVPSWAAMPLGDLSQDTVTGLHFLPPGIRREHVDAGPAVADVLRVAEGLHWRWGEQAAPAASSPSSADPCAGGDTAVGSRHWGAGGGAVVAGGSTAAHRGCDRFDRPTLFQVFDTSEGEDDVRCAALPGAPLAQLAAAAGEGGPARWLSPSAAPASAPAVGLAPSVLLDGEEGAVDPLAHLPRGWVRVQWRDAAKPWHVGDAGVAGEVSLRARSLSNSGGMAVGNGGAGVAGRDSPLSGGGAGGGAAPGADLPDAEWLLQSLRARLGRVGWTRAFGSLCADGTLRLSAVPVSRDAASRRVGVWGGVDVRACIEVCRGFLTASTCPFRMPACFPPPSRLFVGC
jgi:hypothetical protein